LSLKNDIEMVKEELNSEEKFFEKAVMTEKFVKKYKKVMIGAVVGVVLVVAANIGYNISEQNRIAAANEALLTLQKNPEDKEAAKTLESLSAELYNLWSYSEAIKSADVDALQKSAATKAIIISDAASYEVAQNRADIKALESYAQNQNAIYKDMAQVEAALLLIREGKVDEAHAKLSLVSATSPLAQVAQALKHYGVK